MNDTVVGVVVGPVVDKVTEDPRQTGVGVADAFTPVGAGFTVNGQVTELEQLGLPPEKTV